MLRDYIPTEVFEHGPVTVLRVMIPQLDARTASDFKRDIRPALDSQTVIIIDLERVAFIDSSGCGTLISCIRQVTGAGRYILLCGASPQVASLLELTRMYQFVPIYPTLNDAFAALSAGSGDANA